MKLRQRQCVCQCSRDASITYTQMKKKWNGCDLFYSDPKTLGYSWILSTIINFSYQWQIQMLKGPQLGSKIGTFVFKCQENLSLKNHLVLILLIIKQKQTIKEKVSYCINNFELFSHKVHLINPD